MKILGLSCSPRKKGNTVILLEETLKGAEQEGAEIEFISVSGRDIKGCDGCNTCSSKGECHIQDDMHLFYEKMIEADGIIFGTPVYFYGMTAQCKSIMDRTFALRRPDRDLFSKVGGVVAVAGSLGLIDAIKDFYFFFAVKRMLPANFVGAYATGKGDITERKKGLQASFDLGREMVQLVNKKFEYSREFHFNHYAFGTHTH